MKLKELIVGALLGISSIVLAQSVQKNLNVLINGQAAADKAIVINNTTYVPTRVLKTFGINTATQGNNLLLSNSSTAGTTQLAGNTGQIGTQYTLGRNKPLNFALTAAEYSIEPITLKNVYSAEQNQKLLVLRFTVQNPSKEDQQVRFNSFKITAVDDRDENYVFDSYFARAGEFTDYSVYLKPAQKVNLVAAWQVSARAKIVKLLIERTQEIAPIVRYDLRSNIKPLAAPFSNDGFTALPEVQALVGIFYPLKQLAARVESFAFTNEAIEGKTPSAGKRFLTATITVRNLTKNTDIDIYYKQCWQY